MPRSIHKCPNCGEPVSPYAAGCAICGEDLIAARNALAGRRSWADRIPEVRLGGDWTVFALCLLLALAVPIVALILCAFVAWSADNDGDIRRRNLMFVVIGVAFVQLATGYALLYGY